MSTPGRWRPLVAVLANPETRRVAAELMLGATLDRATGGLSPSRRRHITQSLVNSGLIDRESHEFRPDLFRSLLDSSATPKREGVERFMVGDRITQYPASLQVRGELLAHIARTAFDAGELLTEAEVNSRLSRYSDDVAVLRRYLVDHQLLERRSDGTEYALTGNEPIVAVDESTQRSNSPD